jgi:Zn-dependent membrane protease YugP
MFRRLIPGRLGIVTGDFLPHRRKASVRAQVLTVAALTIVAAVAVCLIALH